MSKIVNREGLKAFRERLDEKYVIEGEYSPQTTVGLADNFTPYSEDSGAEQSNPFISNGTGTNNNQEIVTVGDYGLLRSKNGNSVVVNQLVQNGNFESTSGWTSAGGTLSVLNNVGTLTITSSASSNRIEQVVNGIVSGHKYLISYYAKSSTRTLYNKLMLENQEITTVTYETSRTKHNFIFNSNASGNLKIRPYVNSNNSLSNGDTVSFDTFMLVDLTQWFNGDIPQDILDNPSHFYWYHNYGDYIAYNIGTLVNANGVKLVSTGRNAFNKETITSGKCIGSDGSIQTYSTLCYSDYIIVSPNTIYHIKETGAGSVSSICIAYDKNKNFIGTIGVYSGNSNLRLTPPNCRYIIVNTLIAKANEQVVSLYYTPEQGGEGYDKYYQYETPYEVDTGSEVLRSAGSSYDYKTPDGTIHRVIGSYTFTGNETWAMNDQQTIWYTVINNLGGKRDTKPMLSNGLLCHIQGGTNVLRVVVSENSQITSSTNMNQVFPSGTTMNYELNEPTTEQGTLFAENLPINDYGMLYWLDNDNNLVSVPQGNAIFFPINYKGFLDDMYSRVDGDSSKYVIDTDLVAYDTIDTQLKNAIGGTLRQCLCVKENLDFDNTVWIDISTLTFNWQEEQNRWVSNGLASLIKLNKSIIPAISTKYKTYSYAGMGGSDYSEIIGMCYYESNGNFFVRNGSSTEKPSGLIAYEKAS